jgi:hypothetical protein
MIHVFQGGSDSIWLLMERSCSSNRPHPRGNTKARRSLMASRRSG